MANQYNQWSEVSSHCYRPVSTVDEKFQLPDSRCNFALHEMTDASKKEENIKKGKLKKEKKKGKTGEGEVENGKI